MKIGILLNCHGTSIATALQALVPDAKIHHFLIQSVHPKPAMRDHVAKLLSTCDHVITWRFGAPWGKLSTNALRLKTRNVHLMPPFGFRGFHPDTIRVRIDTGTGNLGGPTASYHSRLAVVAFLAGVPADAAAGLYNRLVFSRLGYLSAYARERVLLGERLNLLGVDGLALVDSLTRDGCFMHSYEHPKMAPLLEQARAACRLMGLTPVPGIKVADLPDPLESAPIHPLFPDIADAIGIPPDGMFRGVMRAGTAPEEISLEAFIAGCYAQYAACPRDKLLESDGVRAAAAALGFNIGEPAQAA